MPNKITVYGKTDKGLVRTGNEDYLHLDDRHHVYAVCDGMGGHQAGEVASMTASQILQTVYDNLRTQMLADKFIRLDRSLPENGELLLKAIRLANRSIVTKATLNTALSGMGTTIVAVTFDHDMMSVAHVGDSRAYRIDSKQLTPLTTDHSWVAEIQKAQNLTEEEASSVVGKNIITRALGVKDSVEIDYSLRRVKPGERFLLCSDGLCGYADDQEMFEVIRNGESSEQAVTDLIRMANDRGGADNVTIIILEIDDVVSTSLPEVETFTLTDETDEVLAAQDRWIEAALNSLSKKKDEIEPSSEKPNYKILLGIFFVFLVIVAGIYWLYR